MTLCIQLLGSTEITPSILASLDQIKGVIVCPYDLQRPLFHLLNERFDALSSRIATKKSTPAISDMEHEELCAISQSMCHGFLLKQWFDLMVNCEGNIPPTCDLLQRVREHKPAIDRNAAERQEKLLQELERSPPQKQTETGKKKTRQSFTPITAACWEPPKSVRKARVEVISEEEQLLQSAESMIRNMPEAAIKELQALQVRLQDQPNLRVRIHIGQAEAALMRLEPHLAKIIRLEAKATQFSTLLKEAHDTEPHKFTDHRFYGTMVCEFQRMPATCKTLKSLLDETIPHISLLFKSSAKQQTDADIKMLVEGRCTKALEASQRALNVLVRLNICIQQRKKLNAKRSEYLSTHPEIVKSKPKEDEDPPKPTKEVFQEAEQSLREAQNTLKQLVKLTAQPR